MSNLFTEEKYNALMRALEECAKEDGEPVYRWLDRRSVTQIGVFLVDKLEEIGYIIVKK